MNVQDNLNCIIVAMNVPVNKDVPDLVHEKLNALNALLPLSAKTVVDSKKEYKMALAKYVSENKGMNITTAKLLFDGDPIGSEIVYRYEYAEGLNGEIHYMIKSLITSLSYIKEEMKASLHQQD